MTTPQAVFQAVAAAFGVPSDFANHRSRNIHYAYARFAAWKILRDSSCLMTLQVIADASDRDHGSIIHGVRRAAELIDSDTEFRERFTEAMNTLIQQKPLQYLSTIYT